MNLVVLQGKSNSGKTTTLKKLMIRILQQKDVEVRYVSRRGWSTEPKELAKQIEDEAPTSANNVPNLTIAVIFKGKIIGITSFGDSLKYEILPALNRIIEVCGTCDVFVCGRHKRNDPIKEFVQYQPLDLQLVEKPRSSDPSKHKEDNLAASENLFKTITDLCK